MERELRLKEQQLSEMIKKQNELEMKLIHINLNETETKNDNERLIKVYKKEMNLIKKIINFLLGKTTNGTTITRNYTKS